MLSMTLSFPKRGKLAAAIAIALLASSLTLSGSVGAASAEESQNNQPMLILNPGGGFAADGADGLRIVLNGHDGAEDEAPSDGSDQVWWGGEDNWCCGGAGPILAVGSTASGEAGAASDEGLESWDSLVVSNLSGAVQQVPSGFDPAPLDSSQGSATATLTYTKMVGGLSYVVTRAVSYTFPNNYYDENWTITIPASNTEIVKFYLGGDAQPGGSDFGIGSIATFGTLTSVREANPNSEQFIAYTERNASSRFSYYFVGGYNDPYETIAAGLDLDNSIDTGNHDAGIQIQWTLGSAPGAYERQMRTTVGYNEDIDDSPVADLPETVTESGEAVTESSAPTRVVLPRVDTYSVQVSAANVPVLRFEGVRFWCISSVQIDGASFQFNTGYNFEGNEFLTVEIPQLATGIRDLVFESCMGRMSFHNWLVIPSLDTLTGTSGVKSDVPPVSAWHKTDIFGLDDALRSKIFTLTQNLGADYSRVRCIVNSRNGEELNRAFAAEICAYAKSSNGLTLESFIQSRDSFAGNGYWINIWVSSSRG